MGYVFKEKITLKQYMDFIENQPQLSFMQEDNWAKVKDYANYLIVGVMDDTKLCAVSLIVIKKHKCSTKFFIPNGFLLDFSNKELLEFMTNNIKALARKYHAYLVDVYPNITTNNNNYMDIHTNLLDNGYRWHDRYLDRSSNVIIDLNKRKRKSRKANLKEEEKNSFDYTKMGISMEVSQSIDDVQRVVDLVQKDYCNFDLIANMIYQFQNRIKMIIAKIDLVFYLNYLTETNASEEEITNIKELILSRGETIDIGCALIILPYNKNNRTCEVVYNTAKDIGINLNIMDELINTAIDIAKKNHCQFIKVSNIDLDCDYYVQNYNATPIKYIGEYSIIINKLSYFLNMSITKRKA